MALHPNTPAPAANPAERMHDARLTAEREEWDAGVRALADAVQPRTAHAQRLRKVVEVLHFLHVWDTRRQAWRLLTGQPAAMAEDAIAAGAVRVRTVDVLPLTGTAGEVCQLRVKRTKRVFDVKMGAYITVTE